MSSNRMRDVEVEVQVGGQWYPGWLDPDNWVRRDVRWSAIVRWQSAPAENRMSGFDQDDIRWV